jgi:hypothetical protein
MVGSGVGVDASGMATASIAPISGDATRSLRFLTEPQVFSHPDMGKRFYLFEMTDLWMTDSRRRVHALSAGRPRPT